LNHIDDIAIHGNELVFGFISKARVPGASTVTTRHLVYKARAPLIKDKDDGSWRDGESFSLFNGRDLSGWHALESDREFNFQTASGV
jgi:hypothetical protein